MHAIFGLQYNLDSGYLQGLSLEHMLSCEQCCIVYWSFTSCVHSAPLRGFGHVTQVKVAAADTS